MIWQNPWAWLGLATIAVPILVHLLARRRTRRLLFPTIRFLDAARPMLARRDRLTDLALLAVRCGVIAAAAAALARPWFVTAGRTQDLGRALARAIVVDTSASMRRATPGGGAALEAADREARRLAAEVPAGVIERSAEPAAALAGAVAWLTTQPGRREIVVVSDFQAGAAGAVDAGDLSRLPAEIGVRLVRIDVAAPPGPIEAVSSTGLVETTAHIALAPARTDVTWTTRPRDPDPADRRPRLLAGAAERARAEAAAEAARAIGAPILAEDRPIAVVFPGYEGRDALMKAAGPITDAWMFDTVARIRRDTALAEAAAHVAPYVAPGFSLASAPPFAIAATGAGDRPIVVAARGNVDGRDRLLLFSHADAGSLASAALLASLAGALAPATPIAELDPAIVPDDVLQGWQRPAGSVALPSARDGGGASDGRWFWGVALLLLGLETWMRRTARSQESTEVEHARVA